jgi:hypothetical protein
LYIFKPDRVADALLDAQHFDRLRIFLNTPDHKATVFLVEMPLFKAVKKGQENEKTAKTAKRQGKTIKVRKDEIYFQIPSCLQSILWI